MKIHQGLQIKEGLFEEILWPLPLQLNRYSRSWSFWVGIPQGDHLTPPTSTSISRYTCSQMCMLGREQRMRGRTTGIDIVSIIFLFQVCEIIESPLFLKLNPMTKHTDVSTLTRPCSLCHACLSLCLSFILIPFYCMTFVELNLHSATYQLCDF